MLLITLIISDYSYTSYDQDDFNSSSFPKTINLELID